MTVPSPAMRTNLNATELFAIVFPNGTHYTSRSGEGYWDFDAAKAIARNVALKRGVTVKLEKYQVEEITSRDSSYDLVVNYVDSLKGGRLTGELTFHTLPKGSDSVDSKRTRLIQHLVNECTH